MVIAVYISTSSGNSTVKSRQQYILNILSAAKVPYETKDISSSEEDKKFMCNALKECGKPAIAPQLFSGSEYLGGYDEFLQANENEMLNEFLKTGEYSHDNSNNTNSENLENES